MAFQYTLYNRVNKEALWTLGENNPNANYGISVVVDGSTLIVAASGGSFESGQLVVYPNSDGSGFSSSNKYVLQPGNMPPGSGFGNALSKSLNFLAVGCSSFRNYLGSVYMYEYNRPTNQFTVEQVIAPTNTNDAAGVPLDGMDGSMFSDAVFVDSDSRTLLVSAPNYNQGNGMVFVYLKPSNGLAWQQKSVIPGPKNLSSFFGSPLAATSLLLAASAVRTPHGPNTFGSVFIYSRAGYSGPFVQLQEITAQDAGSFGASIPSFGNSIVMSPDDNQLFIGSGQSGFVFVFSYGDTSGTTTTTESFSFSQRLTAPNPANVAYFGYTMALQGNVIAIGHMTKSILNNNQQGGVYIFYRSAVTKGQWSVLQYISPTNKSKYEYFGTSLAIAPDGTLAVTNVGPRFAKGNMLLFSPACPAGSYVQFQTPVFCAKCGPGTYDSALGSGQSSDVCKPCPANRSGTPAGSSSCASYGSAVPTRAPVDIPPTPTPTAGGKVPSSVIVSAPSLRPTAAQATGAPTLNPTSQQRVPTPVPSRPPFISVSKPTARPSVFVLPLTLAPTLRSNSSSRSSPTKRSPLNPTGSLSSSGSSGGGGGADPDAMSKAAIVSCSLAVVVLFALLVLCYRRYYCILSKDADELEEANDRAATAADAADAKEKEKQRRLTAYDKWCIYEDTVRARRISHMFASADQQQSNPMHMTGGSPPSGTSTSSPGGTVITMLASSPTGNIELNSQIAPRLSKGESIEMAQRLSITSRRSISSSRESSSKSNSSSLALRPSRGSFTELGGLFLKQSGDSTTPSPVQAAAEVVGTDPSALDEDLRSSLAGITEAELPPITVAEAAASIYHAHSLSEDADAGGANTLNPLKGGFLQHTASITSIRAAQSQSGRRLSVTAATRVGPNPLFNAHARRQSLDRRLGINQHVPPGSVATGVLPAGETLATAQVSGLSDVTPPPALE